MPKNTKRGVFPGFAIHHLFDFEDFRSRALFKIMMPKNTKCGSIPDSTMFSKTSKSVVPHNGNRSEIAQSRNQEEDLAPGLDLFFFWCLVGAFLCFPWLDVTTPLTFTKNHRVFSV